MAAPPECCSACGASAEPGQEYCLGCGERIVPARRLSPLQRAWERRLGGYPGDWVLASVLLLLVAAGTATAGIVARRDTRATAGSETIVAISPVVTAPPAPPAPPAPKAKPRPAAKPVPQPQPVQGTGSTTWPARNGYTVVLASIPARATGLADAETKAKQARARGLRFVGVLDSSRFASLHPGYYVVFAGIYDSLEEAQAAARKAAGKFPNGYARQIAR